MCYDTPPTFLLQGFKCHLPLRVVIQVTIMQDLVVQRQAAVPKPLWNTGRQAGEAQVVLDKGAPAEPPRQAPQVSTPGKHPRQASQAGSQCPSCPLPCRRRFPIFRKLLPSHSRFRRCCLISSRISGWIFSRSSLWHTHPCQQDTMGRQCSQRRSW